MDVGESREGPHEARCPCGKAGSAGKRRNSVPKPTSAMFRAHRHCWRLNSAAPAGPPGQELHKAQRPWART